MSMTPGAPIDWAKAACDAVMAAYTPEELPPAGKWHYHQGVFLTGAVQVWERTGDVRYFDYTKRYV
ncbi:MAG: glycoside hydrolase 105 family protein, partial [Paenibacillaceae bacterium]